ncbi:hypothetical protein SRB5_17860 [Streptomyces sp. RB5]|uniref:Acyl-CoA dehydrogenase n=1 Tax=Streptomyces smaragdinus TaxID=2585196 RepID=A0A7K0CDW9_9ACTN|nr:acyl-CoA dehydrogenase [Streptomyces smaragdinus]MQY11667.1 hypothetical protein [Streptomyces smaragdinus]
MWEVTEELRRTGQPGARPDGTHWPLADWLEKSLGDPTADGALSYATVAAEDAAEAFPEEACLVLDGIGVQDFYVPTAFGGSLAAYPQLLEIVRTVARRDLTTAVAHGKTFLGAVCVWLAGETPEALRLAKLIRAGEPVSLGLTERTHGSDLMAGEVVAEPMPGGYLVTGEKWLINNATRGRFICLLGRTGAQGGPRGFSLLMIDKNDLPARTLRTLPKVSTLGIRGADISGIALDGAPVGRDSLVGGEGEGPETVLKALQVTRCLCTALSLGAADHALRLAVSFARERELYGRRMAELPMVRRTLSDAYADNLATEALSLVAARSVHTLPGELSVTSSVAKYLVPTVTDDVINALRGVLGARSFLLDVHEHGRFQKLERDHRIVGIFDGNTMVNLYGLTSQFRTLARNHPTQWPTDRGAADTFALHRPLPDAELDRLSLMSRWGSSVTGSLPASAHALAAAARTRPELTRAAFLARVLADAARDLHTRMSRIRLAPAGAPVAGFDQARAYSICFAAACCAGLWLHNEELPRPDGSAALWEGGLWLENTLARLVTRLEHVLPGLTGPLPHRGLAAGTCDGARERLADHLFGQYTAGRLFSLLDCPVAEGPPC